MRTAVLSLLIATASLARPWHGIEPGVSKRQNVVKKFGEPSKTLTQNGKEILAYLGKEAIRGTEQAQFRIDPATQTVERIDVFPGPKIDKEAVESTYGPMCGADKKRDDCYLKRVSEDFRTYFHYARMGLAIFFNEDGKTVHSFIFQPVKK